MSARDQQSFGRSEPVETLDAYFDRWSQLHGDLDPRGSSLIRGWLTFAYRVAKPLTRTGLSPNGVTIVGVVVAGAVPLLCWIGINASNSVWLWLAVAVTALSGLLDNLDGAWPPPPPPTPTSRSWRQRPWKARRRRSPP